MNNQITLHNQDSNKPFVERIQYINRFLLDKKHPEENLGIWFPYLSASTMFPTLIENESIIDDLIESLYNNLYLKLENTLKKDELNVKLEAILFKDQQVSFDKKRLYFIIKNRTVRKTEITTLCRFYKSGNRIYIALDSYGLGQIKWFPFLRNIFIFIVTFLLTMPFLGIPAIFLGLLMWKNIIKGLKQGETFERAIRQTYPKRIDHNSFDDDDVTMYLKSLLPLILDCVEETFGEYGIDIREVVQQIVQNIQINNNVTGNNNTVGNLSGIALNLLSNNINKKG